MLNENASQLEKPKQKLENNQNKDVNQTKVQTEPSPHNLRKIECTHCKNYICYCLEEIGNFPIHFCRPLSAPKGMADLVVWYSYLYLLGTLS